MAKDLSDEASVGERCEVPQSEPDWHCLRGSE